MVLVTINHTTKVTHHKKGSGQNFYISKSDENFDFNPFFSVIDYGSEIGCISMNMCRMTMKLIFLDSLG